MSTFYDEQKDIVYVKGRYELQCEIDKFAKKQLDGIKSILREIILADNIENVKSNDIYKYNNYMNIESHVIKYLCDSKLIYPSEMRSYFLTENQSNQSN